MSSSPKRPSLISLRRWHVRRDHYLAVFERALLLLRQCPDLPEDELGLTRELWFKLTTARRALDPRGRFGHPVPQVENLPDPRADEPQSYEFKRPDFQWIHDDGEQEDRHAMKAFAVECKRLGAPTNSGWQLNAQYVVSGVVRFCDPLWRYGYGLADGAMVGFVQDMDFDEIAAAIDQNSARMGLSLMRRGAGGWQAKGVSRLDSSFTRRFPLSPFQLFHLWLDVRDVSRRPKKQTRGISKNKTKRKRAKPK